MNAFKKIIWVLVTVAIMATMVFIIILMLLSRQNNSSDSLPPINNELAFQELQLTQDVLFWQLTQEAVALQMTENPILIQPMATSSSGLITVENMTQTAVAFQQQQPPTFTPVPTATPVPPTRVPEVEVIDYWVTADDTLYRITQKQVTSIELMSVYNIAADHIVSGQMIRLPVANPAFCANRGRPYVVREHETVYGISKTFQSTPEQIQLTNELDANYGIRTTQVLCIP